MVTCTVTKGDFPIRMYWMLNGQSLNDFNDIVTSNTNKRVSQVTIESAKAHHLGEYTCIAENSAGIAQHSAYLNINGILNSAHDTKVILFTIFPPIVY